MQSRTKIFSQLVGDYMRRPPVILQADETVAELLRQMVAQKATSALVTDAAGSLIGILTEQDVTRRIALVAEGHESVAELMTTPVQSIGAADYLYYAIAAMRRFGWHHMPVVDNELRPVGLIRLSDALAVAAEQTVELIGRLSHEGSLEGLQAIKAAQVEVADALFADNVPAPDIQLLITDVNRDIHRRIIEAELAAMRQEGHGEPPVEFCAIIMGSGGRGENFLFPDQDNGFILENYPDAEHGRVDSFFITLAERVTRALDAVGFPLCRGNVMATNPLWRKTRAQWHEQIGIWVRRKSFVAVRLSDIFFDFKGVYGDVSMSRELRAWVSEVMRRRASMAFLQEIQRETGEQSVALGWFGRFITERDKPEHKGEMNLKHTGTLPLVHNVRMLALRNGVAATSTLERISALHAQGVLDKDEEDYLGGAFRHITGLLLRQQIRDFQAGREVTNYVHPKSLSERERDILIDSFKAIEELRSRVRGELTAEIF